MPRSTTTSTLGSSFSSRGSYYPSSYNPKGS